MGSKEKKKKSTIWRVIKLVIIVSILFLAYNVYLTATGFKDDGIKVDESPEVDSENKTISFWIEIRNDAYLPLSLEFEINFTDVQHNRYIGVIEETFDVAGQESVNKTLVLEITEDFADYADSSEGLHIKITGKVSGSYAGFIPIPSVEIPEVDTVVHAD